MEIVLDTKQLRNRCLMTEADFFSVGTVIPTTSSGYTKTEWVWDKEKKSGSNVTRTVAGRQSFYIYIDNGAKVLGVAHLDTVKQVKDNWTFEKAKLGANSRKKSLIWNAQLDDRLGVYILLDLLPQFIGQGFDVLLTTDEEIGASTASAFVPPEGKEYNWIFQFDRRGADCVMYQYETPEWRKTVGEFFNPATGSFSDIGKLEHLGVKGMNIGCGYHDEHQDLCYMVREETIDQVYRFLKFYDAHKDTKFPHVKSASKWNNRSSSYGGYRSGDWSEDDYYENYYNRTGKTGATTTSPNAGSGGNLLPSSTTASTGATGEANGKVHRLYDAVFVQLSHYQSKDPYDWFDLPGIVAKDVMFQYPANLGVAQKPANLVRLFVNPITGGESCYCSNCTGLENLSDVFWTHDANPVCATCGMALRELVLETLQPDKIAQTEPEIVSKLALDEDHVVWLKEGGAIRISGKTITRSVVDIPKGLRDKRTWCDICNQPEWADRTVTFHAADTTKKAEPTHVCRWCFDLSQKQNDDEAYDGSVG